MVRREGRWGKLCVDNIHELLSQPPARGVGVDRADETSGNALEDTWSMRHIGESVCKTLSYRLVRLLF